MTKFGSKKKTMKKPKGPGVMWAAIQAELAKRTAEWAAIAPAPSSLTQSVYPLPTKPSPPSPPPPLVAALLHNNVSLANERIQIAQHFGVDQITACQIIPLIRSSNLHLQQLKLRLNQQQKLHENLSVIQAQYKSIFKAMVELELLSSSNCEVDLDEFSTTMTATQSMILKLLEMLEYPNGCYLAMFMANSSLVLDV